MQHITKKDIGISVVFILIVAIVLAVFPDHGIAFCLGAGLGLIVAIFHVYARLIDVKLKTRSSEEENERA